MKYSNSQCASPLLELMSPGRGDVPTFTPAN